INAIARGASDIHIEPYEKSMRIRYRVDGVLFEELKPPLKIRDLITTRIKIMARLDIAERRVPQDGRIKIKTKKKEVDLSVSILPCIHGEKIVMRVLDKGNLSLDLTKLGFEQKSYEDFNKAIHTPWGMLLVTGPTGSGKTTTLYSALSTLNKTTENIMTSEDPVEYNLKGINQVQINADVGLTFAAALRAFLRQDPDIIMVGEIRDYETAEIAIKAALTGHLVLSTLHTNDAPSTISRLSNMGVEPFMIASSVVLVLAQRLVRKICEKCKTPVKIPKKELEKLNISEQDMNDVTFYEGKGCSFCDGSGYKGRIAIYEVMPIFEETKELIINGEPATVLKKHMMSKNINTLRASAVNKFKAGVTTLSEVYRVTAADED
ncbi:MAG TPA: type II secretion system protein GspE, partial [Firmicutes bacterium]|nr:type II secretion system protein GspE [Bacillota bacterium]